HLFRMRLARRLDSFPPNDTRPRKPRRSGQIAPDAPGGITVPAWQKNPLLSKRIWPLSGCFGQKLSNARSALGAPIGEKDLAEPVQVVFRRNGTDRVGGD